MSYGGENYHVNDFVYLIPTNNKSEGNLLQIGQITGFSTDSKGRSPTLSVRLHKRQTELAKACAAEPFSNVENTELFFDEVSHQLPLAMHSS